MPPAVPDLICAADGCTRQRHVAAGWCGMHYYRVKRYGTAEPELARRPRAGACIIPGCDRQRYHSRGWCKRHYERWRRHGDPLKVIVAMPADGSFTISAAHKRVEKAKGRARDHGCIDCGGPAAHWSYDHGDPDELFDPRGYAYSGKVDHYSPRCVPCHKRFDLDWRAHAPAA